MDTCCLLICGRRVAHLFGRLTCDAKTAGTQTSDSKSFTVGGGCAALGAQLLLKGALKV